MSMKAESQGKLQMLIRGHMNCQQQVSNDKEQPKVHSTAIVFVQSYGNQF